MKQQGQGAEIHDAQVDPGVQTGDAGKVCRGLTTQDPKLNTFNVLQMDLRLEKPTVDPER